MKSVIHKLNNYKNAIFAFWKENRNAIIVGIVATVVGGYILFLITADKPSKDITQGNEPEYFDTGTVPESHAIDATEEYRKIRQLNAGLPISTFEEILGEHTFVNSLSNEVIEYVFVNPLFYVEAAVNLEKTVIFYSVTTRKLGFNPRFEFGSWYTDTEEPLVVELGQTTYSELDSMFRGNPVYAAYTSGVNWFYYYESYYVGRPGNYQSYIFSTNQSGFYRSGSWDDEDAPSDWPLLTPSHNIIDNRGLYSDLAISDKDWVKYRENAIINTYTETVPFYGIEDILKDLDKEYFGPNLQQVRLVN